ncbi:MAG: putative DNA-binding domain-containing protein [Alphaproteobacteria bacterium]|nr:putative DNA-binding domain-containing protein [Alphaproteobacteria bacterium]
MITGCRWYRRLILTPFSPEARLSVYRNNVFQALINALVLTFPVVVQLVDERFFRYAAREYVLRHPSMSGNLEEYGREFPDFLRDFRPVAHLPYLEDVARLEWAYLRSYQAKNVPPINIENLQLLPEQFYEKLCFGIHPGAFIIRSDFPVLQLWQQVLDRPDDVDIDLNTGNESILIHRQGIDVKLKIISVAEALFLDSIMKGQTLLEAYDIALKKCDNRGFDLIAAIADAIRDHIFVSYTVD